MTNHTAAPATRADAGIIPVLMARDFTPADLAPAAAQWFDRTAADGRSVRVVLSGDDDDTITIYGFTADRHGRPGAHAFTLTCEGGPAAPMFPAILDTALTHLA